MNIIPPIVNALLQTLLAMLKSFKLPRETQKALVYLLVALLYTLTFVIAQTILLIWLIKSM